MHVRRASLVEGAQDATGTAVIIDVYRAFTTAAFCVAAGAREIVLTASHADALAMKVKDPALFLTGEIGGKPIPGFDAGNSPSNIVDLDLHGRRVVQRTSSGTQGVAAATRAERIVLASFVIVGALWVNHHQLLALVRRATRELMWMNLLLLFFMSLIPLATGFPTLGIRDFTTKEGREKRRKLSRNFWQQRAESSVD